MSSEAMAPVMISTSSPVITDWRVRLNRIWFLLIISPAFLEAFCAAVSGAHARTDRENGSGEEQHSDTHIHGVAASRLLAGVTLGKSPEEGVGQGVLLEVGQQGVVDLEDGEVGWDFVSAKGFLGI